MASCQFGHAFAQRGAARTNNIANQQTSKVARFISYTSSLRILAAFNRRDRADTA
jgi:hypothetical protein